MKIDKNTQYLIGGIIILIIAGFFLFRGTPVESPTEENQNQETIQSPSQNSEQAQAELRMLEGVLQISDDLRQGNLMLETAERKIYIFTSRDFSEFLDQEVEVEIEGTLDSFILVDIEPK